jgi:hypothetical protein
MSAKRSIFFDEWQACLRSHYIHVIRTNDTVTEPTLRAVLLQSGLTEDDLRLLYDEALALGPADPDAGIMLDPIATLVIEPEADEIYAEEPVLPDDSIPEEDLPDISDAEETGTADQTPPPAQQLSLF